MTLHYASQSIKNRLGSEVLRRYKVDEVFLPPFLLLGIMNEEVKEG